MTHVDWTWLRKHEKLLERAHGAKCGHVLFDRLEACGLLRRVWSYNPAMYCGDFSEPIEVYTLTVYGYEVMGAL